jgi:hypothetical protein
VRGEKAARLDRGRFAAAARVLAALSLVVCSCGGEKEEANGVRPGQLEGTAAGDVIAAEGGRILRDIAEARSDILRDFLLRAERVIDRADRMLDLIEQSTATAELRDRTWVARRHLEYETIQDVAGDLLPIYAAVDQVESLTPADSIRGHLARTKRQLDKGDRRAAGRELARADQELLLVEVDLPLRSARHQLAEAREALAMGQLDRAGASLRQAEDALVLLTSTERSPLGAAQWALAKAVAAYEEGGPEEAARYVTLARQSLERASEDGSEASRATLEELVDELRGLEGRIATPGSDALLELEQLVDRVGTRAHQG